MDIKVLGTGCPKCNKLESMVKEILQESGSRAQLSKVSDINEIAKAGVMLTPALMINEDILFSGKLPPKEKLKEMISAAENKEEK